jgi:hypothetical protein
MNRFVVKSISAVTISYPVKSVAICEYDYIDVEVAARNKGILVG